MGPRSARNKSAALNKAGSAASASNRKRAARKIRLLLVDDHALVRRAFRRVIEDDPDITVVGEAGDGAQAIKMARQLKPSVVLMDCALPGLNGLLAARQIVKFRPKTAVLMCSMHSAESWVRRAIDAGARGYILKSAKDSELVSAIQRVAAGELVFAWHLLGLDERRAKQESRLTAREIEVLQLMAHGKSNSEIAAHLGISVNTVHAHRISIMHGLRIHKVAKLIAYAIRSGLASFV